MPYNEFHPSHGVKFFKNFNNLKFKIKIYSRLLYSTTNKSKKAQEPKKRFKLSKTLNKNLSSFSQKNPCKSQGVSIKD